MARLTLTHGAHLASSSLPLAVTYTGQLVTGSFTSTQMVINLEGGGTGTYGGRFLYAPNGGGIYADSRITSYVHDSPVFGYSLTGISLYIGEYFDYLDSNDLDGMMQRLFRGPDVMTGGGSDDFLNGYGGSDHLIGGGGDDQFEGGPGRDTLVGGLGNDYYEATSQDVLIEAPGGGTDTVVAFTSFTLSLNLERLVLLTTAGNAKGTGNPSSNVISGNAGNNELLGLGGADTLKGAGGKDTLNGGTGDDRLEGASGNDVFILLAGQGNDKILETTGEDTVRTSLNNYTLAGKIENLVQLGSAKLTSNGNALGNEMFGNAANSRLRGGDGGDLLAGGLGNDTLEGQNHNDSLDGGTGRDRLFGGAGDDVLYWDASGLDITVHGDDGSDTLKLTATGSLDLAAVTADIEGVDVILLAGNTLQLDAARVIAISDNGTLRIDGGGGDQLVATDGWAAAGTTTIEGALYNVYTSGDATLQVRDGLTFEYVEVPVITSDGGSESASVDLDENNDLVTTVTSSDPEVTYSIAGGADMALFTIDAESGELSFISAPDFENPLDAGADNLYEVTVQAANNIGTDTQTISVTVSDSPAPVVTSEGGGASAGVAIPEGEDHVTTVTSTSAAAAYSISGGADAGLFTIDPESGELSFNSAPDFENPIDVGADNVYEVTVQASDSEGADTQDISVTVNDSPAPVVTSDDEVIVTEGDDHVTTVTSNSALAAFSITGGADAALFTINPESGELSFISAPDFENPLDVGVDNAYEVTVQAADPEGGGAQTVSITVSDIAAPAINSDGGGDSANISASEDKDLVTTVDTDVPNSTYSIAGGDDAALFTIDAASGALAFAGSGVDFDVPADADGDNVYEVTVQAANSEGSDTQAISVTVNEAQEPVSVSGPAGRYIFSPGDFFDGEFQAIKITDPVYYGNTFFQAEPFATGFVPYIAIEAGELFYQQSSDNAGALGFSDSISFQVQDSLGNLNEETTYTLSIGLLTWFGHNLTTDAFTGNDSAETLSGLALNDTLNGGGGDDSIWGGEDSDRLTGGPGNDFIHPGGDTFSDLLVYNAVDEGSDFIAGFTPSEDSVVFAGAAKTALDDNGTAGLNFVTNTNVNFTNGAGSDACLITAAASGISDAELLDLSAVAAEIMIRAVTAGAGHDGLFVIQAEFDTGVYYYAESSGANDVSSAELSRLAVFDNEWLDQTDFLLG